LVLGLLLSSNAYSGEYYQGKHGSYKQGISKVMFCEQEWPAGWSNSFCRKASPYFQNGVEINDSWKVGGQKRFAIFKNVNRPIRDGFSGKNFGDGTFHAIAYSWSEAQSIVDKLENKTFTSSQNTGDKIAQSKQICKDLGFKTNTEKFADCALKMMSLQFEASNKVASSSGGTTQKIIIDQGYDVWDAMIDMSGILSNNNSSSYLSLHPKHHNLDQ
jgi:hypothetical protein